MDGGVEFMIIGTPRSGTTLTQRLACEIPGISVPPETHFFSAFAPGLLRRTTFPVEGDVLRRVVAQYSKLRQLDGDGPPPGEVYDLLAGRAETVFDLFQAIVRASAGPSEVYGEKTPEHLLWCPTLASAVAGLRFIAVVRDPRAVVASLRTVSWSTKNPARSARRWSCDQRQVRAALRALGPARLLVLRYEDMVQDPDAARTRISLFLDTASADSSPGPVAAAGLFRPSETWKAGAMGPVSSDRIDRWKSVLARGEISQIESICRPEMLAFGYTPPGSPRRTFQATDWLKGDHYRFRRSMYQQKIRWIWARRGNL